MYVHENETGTSHSFGDSNCEYDRSALHLLERVTIQLGGSREHREHTVPRQHGSQVPVVGRVSQSRTLSSRTFSRRSWLISLSPAATDRYY